MWLLGLSYLDVSSSSQQLFLVYSIHPATMGGQDQEYERQRYLSLVQDRLASFRSRAPVGSPALETGQAPASAAAAEDMSRAERGEGSASAGTPPDAPAVEAQPNGRGENQETHDRRPRAARRKSTLAERRGPGKCAPCSRGSGWDCHHRVRTRIRHAAANGRCKLSAFRVAQFAIFLFLVTLYTQKCLQKGFSRFSLGYSAFHRTKDSYDDGSPSQPSASSLHQLDWRGGLVRRLSDEERFYPRSGQEGNNGGAAAEAAFCAALEASAQARRAAAAEAQADSTDEETADPSTHPPSM